MTEQPSTLAIQEQVITIIKTHRSEMARFGVKDLAIFGSVTRGTASPISDVDVLVEFSRPIGLFDFIRLKKLMEKWLGREVDLATPDALRPIMRDRILNEAIHITQDPNPLANAMKQLLEESDI